MQRGKLVHRVEGERTEGKTDDDKISCKISWNAKKLEKTTTGEQMLGKNDLNPRVN
jgi:hypothetical protein